jgi:RimJ/RimL family protein N-acetyltransferase
VLAVAPVVLSSSHVELRPLALEHVAPLAAAAGARATYALTQVPDGLAAMRAYVDSALADAAAGRALPFAVVAGGAVVGSTRFGNLERWGGRPAGCVDAVEIGWTWLAEGAQRTSVNTACKRLLLAHAFEAWEVLRVTLKTDARNARSRAAIERLGARLDGVLRAHMPAADGGIRDSAVYSILAAEWPEVRARLDSFLARR